MNMKGNYSVEFRAYDNGIAYRFITDRKIELEVLDEEFAIHSRLIIGLICLKLQVFKTSYRKSIFSFDTMDYSRRMK